MFEILSVLNLLLIVHVHNCIAVEVHSRQAEHCIRFKVDNSMTARQFQAYFCGMMVPEGEDAAKYILNCMEQQGIKPTDDDMQGFVLGKFTFNACLKATNTPL